jgi:hypothetical protein
MIRGFLFVLALGILVWAFSGKFEPVLLPLRQEIHHSNLVAKVLRLPAAALSPAKLQNLTSKLHSEALLVGQTDSAPEQTEQRLQEWARGLSVDELGQLKTSVLDLHTPQDDRFLAIMLIGWSEKIEALDLLNDIAVTPIDPFLSPNRMGDFEKVLRMQAIDGILNLSSQSPFQVENALRNIATRSDDTTVTDRAHRALWSLHGDAPTPQKQEENALSELLTKNSNRN